MNPQDENLVASETDGNLGPKQRKLAKPIAQRLAVERASRQFKMGVEEYDWELDTAVYHYRADACYENLCRSGQTLCLLLSRLLKNDRPAALDCFAPLSFGGRI